MTLREYVATFTSREVMDVIVSFDRRSCAKLNICDPSLVDLLHYVTEKTVDSFERGVKISLLLVDTVGRLRPTREFDEVGEDFGGLIAFVTLDGKAIQDLYFEFSEIQSMLKSNKRDKLISNVLG